MNKTIRQKYWVCFLIIGVVLLCDQLLKIWIKTRFAIGDDVALIGEWCRFHFVENEGIAFGLAIGGVVGKYCLTLFRVVASGVIFYLLLRQIKKNSRYLLLISISLIFVGAVGNVVDSCFYGLIFSESTHSQIATLFPDGGGYGRFLLGKVVDMFYFPICEWTWPTWVPGLGGREAEFFSAIFNIADAAICVGVALLIVDQYIVPTKKEADTEEEEEQGAISAENDVESVEKTTATTE